MTRRARRNKCADSLTKGVTRQETWAIATAILAIIILILIALIGAGAYLYLSRMGGIVGPTTSSLPATSTSSPSTFSSSNVATTSQAVSSTSTTSILPSSTSTVSTLSSVASSASGGASGYPVTWNDLFGNYTQMTVMANSSSGPGNASYVVLGHFGINSTQYTEVNYTQGGNGQLGWQILWFNTQSTIGMVTYQGSNYTAGDSFSGENITQVLGGEFGSYFSFVSGGGSVMNGPGITNLGQYQNLGTSTQTFGSTQLSVTSYTDTVNQLTYVIHVANVPNTSLYLVTYSSFGSGGSVDSYQILSLTRA